MHQAAQDVQLLVPLDRPPILHAQGQPLPLLPAN